MFCLIRNVQNRVSLSVSFVHGVSRKSCQKCLVSYQHPPQKRFALQTFCLPSKSTDCIGKARKMEWRRRGRAYLYFFTVEDRERRDIFWKERERENPKPHICCPSNFCRLLSTSVCGGFFIHFSLSHSLSCSLDLSFFPCSLL